jgi:hypothetical protein
MRYFVFSFLAGGLLTLIPISRRILLLLQSVFYTGSLETWRMFVLWGLIFSGIFFASKEQIKRSGFIKFWWFAFVFALFITLFALFASSGRL